MRNLTLLQQDLEPSQGQSQQNLTPQVIREYFEQVLHNYTTAQIDSNQGSHNQWSQYGQFESTLLKEYFQVRREQQVSVS